MEWNACQARGTDLEDALDGLDGGVRGGGGAPLCGEAQAQVVGVREGRGEGQPLSSFIVVMGGWEWNRKGWVPFHSVSQPGVVSSFEPYLRHILFIYTPLHM